VFASALQAEAEFVPLLPQVYDTFFAYVSKPAARVAFVNTWAAGTRIIWGARGNLSAIRSPGTPARIGVPATCRILLGCPNETNFFFLAPISLFPFRPFLFEIVHVPFPLFFRNFQQIDIVDVFVFVLFLMLNVCRM
jgi:hypothetical protein